MNLQRLAKRFSDLEEFIVKKNIAIVLLGVVALVALVGGFTQRRKQDQMQL